MDILQCNRIWHVYIARGKLKAQRHMISSRDKARAMVLQTFLIRSWPKGKHREKQSSKIESSKSNPKRDPTTRDMADAWTLGTLAT